MRQDRNSDGAPLKKAKTTHEAGRPMESAAGAVAEAAASWRAKCISRWNLREVPSAWCEGNPQLAAHYEKLSRANDTTWKRYHKRRLLFEKKRKNSEEDYHDDFNANLRKLATKRLEDHLSTPGGRVLVPHVVVILEDSICDDIEPRSYEFEGVIFSPFALPRAVRLKHKYHNRGRLSWVEFFVDWAFQLTSFDGVSVGDEVQQRLAEQFPKGISGRFQHCGNDGSGFEDLCGARLLDPPETHDIADIGSVWSPVYDLQKDNLSPTTVRRLRSWLFGSACQATKQLVSDWDLLVLLFASCGSDVRSGPLRGRVGYSWEASFAGETHVRKILKAEGCDSKGQDCGSEESDTEDSDSEGGGPSVSWLEHAARTATGALRPIDSYFEPYDLLEAKAIWGRKVLDARITYRLRNFFDEDAGEDFDEDSEECKAPWIIWETAETGGAALSGTLAFSME